MKKSFFGISVVTAMIGATTMFSACSSDDEQQQSPTSYLLSLDAEKAGYADLDGKGTRAITLSGEDIVTAWESGDLVTVYDGSWQSKIGDLKPKEGSTGTTRTKLEGVISTTNLKAGDALNLIYPRAIWQYTGQKGTFEDIAKNFDYITTGINVVYIDPSNTSNPVYSTTALFGKAEQAIVRFTICDANDKALAVPELTITAAGNQLVKSCSLDGTATDKGGALVVTPASDTNVFYVAIRNDNPDPEDYTLTVKAGTQVYTYTKSKVTFERGSFYKVKVKMQYNDNTYTERDSYVNAGGEEVWQ